MLLCCGEALIDMIPTPTASGQEGYVPHVGGAVFNTAIALGRLGVQTGMLTGLSSDLFGQQLTASLHANHVDTSLVVQRCTNGRRAAAASASSLDGCGSNTSRNSARSLSLKLDSNSLRMVLRNPGIPWPPRYSLVVARAVRYSRRCDRVHGPGACRKTKR